MRRTPSISPRTQQRAGLHFFRICSVVVRFLRFQKIKHQRGVKIHVSWMCTVSQKLLNKPQGSSTAINIHKRIPVFTLTRFQPRPGMLPTWFHHGDRPLWGTRQQPPHESTTHVPGQWMSSDLTCRRITEEIQPCSKFHMTHPTGSRPNPVHKPQRMTTISNEEVCMLPPTQSFVRVITQSRSVYTSQQMAFKVIACGSWALPWSQPLARKTMMTTYRVDLPSS